MASTVPARAGALRLITGHPVAARLIWFSPWDRRAPSCLSSARDTGCASRRGPSLLGGRLRDGLRDSHGAAPAGERPLGGAGTERLRDDAAPGPPLAHGRRSADGPALRPAAQPSGVRLPEGAVVMAALILLARSTPSAADQLPVRPPRTGSAGGRPPRSSGPPGRPSRRRGPLGGAPCAAAQARRVPRAVEPDRPPLTPIGSRSRAPSLARARCPGGGPEPSTRGGIARRVVRGHTAHQEPADRSNHPTPAPGRTT